MTPYSSQFKVGRNFYFNIIEKKNKNKYVAMGDSNLSVKQDENPGKNIPQENQINTAPIFTSRFCCTCLIVKPPRTSHCSICDNCVKNFDQ